MDVQTYQELQEIPKYGRPVWEGNEVVNRKEGLPMWSGKGSPPAIGAYIQGKFNVGPCRVVGYFVESGWLGIKAIPLKPNDTILNNVGYNQPVHIFGAEMEPGTIDPPEIEGPSLEQLAALDKFAQKYGRMWKSKLNEYWMNGRDAQEPDGHFLRQVRNTFGPSWLHSKKNPIKYRGN